MTTYSHGFLQKKWGVVEAYRLDRYDNIDVWPKCTLTPPVVEAYRLDRYDNLSQVSSL